VTDGVYRLSANVDNILFEGMWPVPKGVAMNSYLVKGEKAAIIDGVCTWDGVPETLFAQLQEMNTKLEDIDYVIINHMEPDHSGWLEPFAELRGRNNFEIYCTERAVPLLEHFYGVTENVHPVKSGDTLDLGGGRQLEFYEIPNVHWPETMATFDRGTGTLFPCDAFGSFGSVESDAPYDDQLSQEDIDFFEREASRYYANIVAVFSGAVQKAIHKLGGLPINIIAPGHGIVWRQHPNKIIHDYVRYAGYASMPAKPEVAVIWGSMYGMTQKAVDPLVKAIEAEGVRTRVHRVPETQLSYVLHSVWECSGVALGMPTYEYKMFPPMSQVLDEIGRKRIVGRKAFRFGSFGWYGGAEKELHEINDRLKMKWDFLPSVEFQGSPKEEHVEEISERGRELARQVKAAAGEPAA
jgi:flavorubredoxin